MMNCKVFGGMRSWPNLRYYPGIGLSKTTKNLRQDSRFPGRDMKPEPEYEAGALTTRPRHSIPDCGTDFIMLELVVNSKRNFMLLWISEIYYCVW
jgi:hypothetical protein